MTEPTVTIPTIDLAAVLVIAAAVAEDPTNATSRCWLALTDADRPLQEEALMAVAQNDRARFGRIANSMLDVARADVEAERQRAADTLRHGHDL